jgi:hypothetical protein
MARAKNACEQPNSCASPEPPRNAKNNGLRSNYQAVFRRKEGRCWISSLSVYLLLISVFIPNTCLGLCSSVSNEHSRATSEYFYGQAEILHVLSPVNLRKSQIPTLFLLPSLSRIYTEKTIVNFACRSINWLNCKKTPV